MIMSGCNIAAEVDAIDEDGDVMEGEGEEGVGAEGVREEGKCAMEISGNAVPNGAGNVIPVPSDRASSGSIPELTQWCHEEHGRNGTTRLLLQTFSRGPD